jgi:hypothetical protein
MPLYEVPINIDSKLSASQHMSIWILEARDSGVPKVFNTFFSFSIKGNILNV